MNNSQKLAFTVPIDGKMIKIAEQLSNQQRNQQKTYEVYLNTLAVLAVDFYCQCMEIETELEKSYGLDIVMPCLMNTASLCVKSKHFQGLIECRPVLPKDEFCYIPAEVLSGRIGYVVVEVDEANRKARILGFVGSVQTEKLPLTRLRSLQDFLSYLSELDQAVAARASASAKVSLLEFTAIQVSEGLVKLSRWFEGLLDSGWQSELAIAKNISYVNVTEKKEVGGAKFIHLMNLSEPVLLILRQIRLSQDEIEIVLRLYPATESIFLLDGTKMTLLDDENHPIPQLEKQAKASNWLQLKFRGNVGDKFNLKISLGEDSVTERFVI